MNQNKQFYSCENGINFVQVSVCYFIPDGDLAMHQLLVGSDNGLLLIRHQAMIWTNADEYQEIL